MSQTTPLTEKEAAEIELARCAPLQRNGEMPSIEEFMAASDRLDVARFPGPWTVRLEQPWGFEITRALGGGESEWMVDEAGAIAVFDTEQEAREYLAQVSA